jgi:transcriptional regulator with XRE-family HTH domain
MIKYTPEDLAHYVRRVMRQKGLTLRDVELRSGGGITDGYVSGIITGTARNPSVEKIKALALGLGVDLDEVFHAACGLRPEMARQSYETESASFLELLDLMQNIAVNEDLLDIVRQLVRLRPDERMVVLQTLRMLNRPESEPETQRGKEMA